MTQSEWKEAFKNKLATIMEERGFTQNRLARETGLSTSRINDYLKNGAVPTVFAVANMAYVLDVSARELIDFDERITK